MLAGIISDTRNLSKSTTCAIDTIAWQALTAQLGISADSAQAINNHMAEAAYDYSDMTDADILLSDYKNYEIAGKNIGFGSLACKQADMGAFIARMLAVMPQVMADKGRQMMFTKIDNLVPNPDASQSNTPYIENGLYFIYYGEGTKAIAEPSSDLLSAREPPTPPTTCRESKSFQ